MRRPPIRLIVPKRLLVRVQFAVQTALFFLPEPIK